MGLAVDIYYDLRTFFETGGEVLVLIFVMTLVMWMLILDRYWFYYRIFPDHAERAAATWKARTDRASHAAIQFRDVLVARAEIELGRTLAMIHALVAVSPLLGLLGTVTGMIEVYEVMALAGSGNARAMAAGVSKAMITTMAGLFSALSGIIFLARLERTAHNLSDDLDDDLIVDPMRTPSVHQPRCLGCSTPAEAARREAAG